MVSNAEHVFNHLANSRLRFDIMPSSLTLELHDSSDFRRAWDSGDEMFLTLVNGAANREVIKVTDINGNILTIERAQDGTSSMPWYAGTLINQRLPNVNLERMKQAGVHRTVTSLPHGSLVPEYPGEAVLYDARWWKASGTLGGADETNWRLVAGTIDLDTEEYDEDGYVVEKPAPSFSAGIIDMIEFSGEFFVGLLGSNNIQKSSDMRRFEDAASFSGVCFGIHNDKLYAGRNKQVWEYQGQDVWNEVWQSQGFPSYITVIDLVSFSGQLYGGCNWFSMYRYPPIEEVWEAGARNWKSLVVHDGTLYMGGYPSAAVYYFIEPYSLGFIGTCGGQGVLYRLVSHNSNLYAATENHVWKWITGQTWEDFGDPSGDGTAVFDLISFNSNLYGLGAKQVSKYIDGTWVDQETSKEITEYFNRFGIFGGSLYVGTQPDIYLKSHIYLVE